MRSGLFESGPQVSTDAEAYQKLVAVAEAAQAKLKADDFQLFGNGAVNSMTDAISLNAEVMAF